MLLYELIIIGIMLFINAVFAAYEMGLASISAARLRVLLEERKRGAADAVHMKNRIEASLAVIQFGITLAGAFAAATGGVGIGERLSPFLAASLKLPELAAKILAIVFLIIPLTFVITVFGELVPKILGLNNNEWIVLKLSPFMRKLSIIAEPVVSVVEAVVRGVVEIISKLSRMESKEKGRGFSDFRAAVAIARASKILSAREEKIVLSSALFSMRPV